MKRLLAVVLPALCMLSVRFADAAVLCKKRSGIVLIRDACKKKESVVDLSELGLYTKAQADSRFLRLGHGWYLITVPCLGVVPCFERRKCKSYQH